MNSLVKNKHLTRLVLRSLVLFLISLLIVTSYEIAFAANTTSSTGSSNADPIGQQLCSIITVVQGNTAKVIAIAALLSVGIGLFMGKVNMGVALTTALGVVIMFGAPKIVGFLGATSGNCSTSSATS